MRHKLTLLLLTFIAGVLSVAAQVSFSVSYKRVSPTEIDIVFTGKMEKVGTFMARTSVLVVPLLPLSAQTTSKVFVS